MGNRGCDLTILANAGVPVKVDNDKAQKMHHKFCVIDHKFLMNGSFNWTWAAVAKNYENVVIQDNQEMIKIFSEEFMRLWGDTINFEQIPSNGEVDPKLETWKPRSKKNSRRGSPKKRNSGRRGKGAEN